MSDLQQYKMPIIEDVNDIPSVPEDPTHPNASLFCKQYNDLIDDLNNTFQENCTRDFSASTIMAYPPNIQVTTKTELLNAINNVPSRTIYQEIRLMNDLLEPISFFDFCKSMPIFSGVYGHGEKVVNQFDKGITIRSLITPRATIKINNNYDFTNFETTSTPYTNIYAPQGVQFRGIRFDLGSLGGFDALNIRDSIVLFDSCIFDISETNNFFECIIQAVNSKLYFQNCIFNWNSAVSNIFSLIYAHYCDITFDNLTTTAGYGKQFIGERSSFSFNNVTPTDFNLKATNGWVHIKKSSGALLSDYTINASNFIKEII